MHQHNDFEFLSLLYIRRFSIIDFHAAFPSISHEAKSSNIPLFPIVIPKDVRNNGTLRNHRLARSRCIIHRSRDIDGCFRSWPKRRVSRFRFRNHYFARSSFAMNAKTTKRPRETTGTEPSRTEVVVIVVSRLKLGTSPLTRNLRLTGADSISSRSAGRSRSACIIHNQFPNPELKMNQRPGQLPPSPPSLHHPPLLPPLCRSFASSFSFNFVSRFVSSLPSLNLERIQIIRAHLQRRNSTNHLNIMLVMQVYRMCSC